MKYLKLWNSWTTLFEELDKSTYINAADKLNKLGYIDRANEIRFHVLRDKMNYRTVKELNNMFEKLEYEETGDGYDFTIDDEIIMYIDSGTMFMSNESLMMRFDIDDIYDDEMYIILRKYIHEKFGLVLDEFKVIPDYLFQFRNELDVIENSYNASYLIDKMFDWDKFVDDASYDDIYNNDPYSLPINVNKLKNVIYNLDRETIDEIIDDKEIDRRKFEEKELDEDDVYNVLEYLQDHYDDDYYNIVHPFVKASYDQYENWSEYIHSFYGREYNIDSITRDNESMMNHFIWNYCYVEKINDELKDLFDNHRSEYYDLLELCGMRHLIPQDYD